MKAPIPAGRLGAGDPCPLCGATAGVAPGDDGFSCLTCGAPRIVVDGAIARSGAERPMLERARALKKERAAWGLLSGAAGAFGAIALVVSGVIAALSHLGGMGGEIAAALSLGPLLLSAFGFSRVRGKSRAMHEALANAEVLVATDLSRAQRRALEGPELARLLHVSAARGEELAATLQVEQFLAEGDAAPVQRVRVDASDASSPDGPDAATATKARPDR